MKPSRCKVCRCEYVKARPLQKVCGLECAKSAAEKLNATKKAKEATQDRRQTRQKLDAIQTRPELVKKAQTAFNSFIRARDAGKLCISCNTRLPSGGVGGAFDCGHYRSVGSAPHMRFVEDNAHGQCKKCNMYLSGNHVEYRKGLIERIGIKEVELIESDNTLRKTTREGLEEIARHYREEARKMNK
jgi:hypothetical protein